MLMRSFSDQDDAGIYGVVVWLMILGITAFIWLVFNTFLGYFFDLMPSGYTADFFSLLWIQGGLFIIIFIVSSFSLLLYMQKSKYPFAGGFQ